uniref:Serine-threonine/tyrosine-protein kinase catalytic domain-containing protein n=1 Tax=Acrobeloides nanus TaxID=290746 RepID=A0A914EA33_9BILA
MLKHCDAIRICYDKVVLLWLAIECLKEQTFSVESDVWAFGFTCWEIFNYGRKTPYQDEKIKSIERMINFLEIKGGWLKQNS